MIDVSYYPGCSLEGTATDYAESIQAVCRTLGIQLHEVPGWNCCGATAAHSIASGSAIELGGRVLAIAGKMPHADVLIPCPMCFNRLKTSAFHQNEKEPAHTDGSMPRLWDLADFFATEEMRERVAIQIKNPLEGLRVVSYYGCMASRPPEITGAADWENPQSLDRIVENLGGSAIQWPYKTDCCGASQTLSRPDMVFRLVENLLEMAERVGASGIAVSCQMCQANLDMFQMRAKTDEGKRRALPVYYFTELIGLALELGGVRRWLSKHLTDPFTLLRKLEILT